MRLESWRMDDSSDFTFPTLPAPKVPLTARSTVVDGSTRSGPMPPPQARPVSVKAPSERRPGKVPLEKGYSQMDWMRIARTHPDLAGLRGGPLRRDISMKEVAQHRSQEDAWLVYNGKVYNVTPYIRFHPGGVKYIMLGAGRDATSLFNKYHAWVNIDFLMANCLVGLVGASTERSAAVGISAAGVELPSGAANDTASVQTTGPSEAAQPRSGDQSEPASEAALSSAETVAAEGIHASGQAGTGNTAASWPSDRPSPQNNATPVPDPQTERPAETSSRPQSGY